MNGFELKLAGKYLGLSAKLRNAADYVVAHPVAIATRSVRSISSEIGLAPVTFTRMARALGYDSYEDLREEMRGAVANNRATSFSDRVAKLQADRGNDGDEKSHDFSTVHIAASRLNLDDLGNNIASAKLESVVDRLATSRRVLAVGALGSAGIAEYMVYLAALVTGNWQLVGRMGASLGNNLVGIGEEDTLIVITKQPYAKSAVRAAEIANQNGAFVVVITDSHKCPANMNASQNFIVPTQSSHFFSSYVATIALIEAMIGLLAMRCGSAAQQRIQEIENSNRRLEYLT